MVSRQEVAEKIFQLSNSDRYTDWSKWNNLLPVKLIRLGVRYQLLVKQEVLRDAVGDRSPEAHEANLFDIDAKYGDVVSSRDAMQYLHGLERPASTAAEDFQRWWSNTT